MALAGGMAIFGGAAAYQENYLSAQNYYKTAEMYREYAGKIRDAADEQAATIKRAGFEQVIGIKNQAFYSRIAQNIEAQQVAGAIRARAGASGADVSYGTPAQVEYTQRANAKLKSYMMRVEGETAAEVARLNADRSAQATIRQAELQAQATEMQAEQARQQALALDATRGASILSGMFQGASSGFNIAKGFG